MTMAFIEDIYDIVNTAVDIAFVNEKYQLNFFEYLKGENFKKEQVTIFIQSTLFTSIKDQVDELDLYLLGGDSALMLREAYSWMGKPRARKVRDYLNNIMEDARKYEQSKRRGRKPGSKNKKAPATTTK
jgi:hypothetical protein